MDLGDWIILFIIIAIPIVAIVVIEDKKEQKHLDELYKKYHNDKIKKEILTEIKVEYERYQKELHRNDHIDEISYEIIK